MSPTTTVISLFLVVSFNSVISTAGEIATVEQTDSHRNRIAEIQREFDQEPYSLSTYYPFCSEVLRRFISEKREIAMITGEEIFQEIETDEAVIASKNSWSTHHFDKEKEDVPNALLAHWKKKAAAPQGAVLSPNHFALVFRHPSRDFLASTTPVIRLHYRTPIFPDIPVWNATRITNTTFGSPYVSDLVEGQYILSSTIAVVDDPRYVKDCWAFVSRRQPVDPPNGEFFRVITIQPQNWGPFTIWASPTEQFYVSKADGLWDWYYAEQINVGDRMLSSRERRDFTGTVSAVENRARPWLLRMAYSLRVPETYTHYVGISLNQKVLVGASPIARVN